LTEIFQFRGKKTLNMALVGPSGVGKSSFVNTVKGIFDEKIDVVNEERAEVGSNQKGGNQTTKKLSPYTFDIGNGLTLKLWDTRGVSTTDEWEMQKKCFSSISAGKVQEDTPFAVMEKDDGFISHSKIEGQQMDIVIFILHRENVEGEIKNMKEIYDIAEKQKVISVFAVSHLDEILGTKPEAEKDSAEAYYERAAELKEYDIYCSSFLEYFKDKVGMLRIIFNNGKNAITRNIKREYSINQLFNHMKDKFQSIIKKGNIPEPPAFDFFEHEIPIVLKRPQNQNSKN